MLESRGTTANIHEFEWVWSRMLVGWVAEQRYIHTIAMRRTMENYLIIVFCNPCLPPDNFRTYSWVVSSVWKLQIWNFGISDLLFFGSIISSGKQFPKHLIACCQKLFIGFPTFCVIQGMLPWWRYRLTVICNIS